MRLDAVQLVALCLATYRVARLIARESGPADVCLRWRRWVEARGWIDLDTSGYWCLACASVWASVALAGLVALVPAVGWPVVYALAASGAAVLLWSWEGES